MRLRLLVPLLLAACGDASSTPDADPHDASVGDGGVAAIPRGTLSILEDRWINPSDGTISPLGRIQGLLFEAPPIRWHRDVATAGDCVLKTYTPASCTPACSGDQVCVEPDVCETAPSLASAGRLTITGLTLPMTIDPSSGYYGPTQSLPDDLFAEGATITATFAGAAIPGMTLTRQGVAPLVADLGNRRVLEAGRAHVITWTPTAAGDSRVKLTFNANNSGHGAPYAAIIECDVLDRAGSISVPPELIDAFPATSAWEVCAGSDCPPSTLTRYRRDIVSTAGGEIWMIVGSQLSFGIDHAVL